MTTESQCTVMYGLFIISSYIPQYWRNLVWFM